MLRNLLLAAFVFLSASVAHATGVLLAPREVVGRYSLRTETAVISVAPDRTVTTDLFFSLRTSSRAADAVSLLVPLQTTPKTYKAEGTALKQFEKAYVWDISTLPGRAEDQWRNDRRTLREACILSSFLAGPCAVPLAGSVAPWEPPMIDCWIPGLGGSPPAGTFPVVAHHVSAEVYPSLRVDDLVGLARLTELPAHAQQTLAGYAGRPFLLVHLWCVPDTYPPDPNVDEWREQPGLHISFSQTMLPGKDAATHRYTFPLRTLAAWPSLPYYLELYVTAAESLSLRVRFPDRPSPSDGDAWKQGPGRDTAALNGRQVYLTHYSPKHSGANPSGYVEVSLVSTGRSELVAQRRARDLRTAALICAYPLLAIASWLLACRVFLPWCRGERLRTVLGSWFAAYGLLVLLIAWGGSLLLDDMTYLAFPGVWGRWSWFMQYTYEDYIYARVVPAVVLLSAVTWLIGCLILPREPEIRLGGRAKVAVVTWLVALAITLPIVVAVILVILLFREPFAPWALYSLAAVTLFWLVVRWAAMPAMRALPPGLLWRLPLASVLSAAIYLFGASLLRSL